MTPSASGTRGIGWRGALSLGLGTLLTAGGLYFVIRRVVDDWSEVEPLLADASPGWIVVAAVVAIVGMAGVGLRWHRCLLLLGAPAERGAALGWFARGQLGKYVPGGIWHVIGQGELATRAGIARGVGYASVLLATIGLYGAAAITATGLAVPARGGGPSALVALVAIGAALVVFEPRVLRAVLHRRTPTVRIPTRPQAIRYLVGGIWVWIVIAAATVAVASAIDGGAPVFLVAAAATASWLVGFLALPAPGGLGVREATFVVLTEHELGSAVAASVALCARMVFVVADLALPFVVAFGDAARQRLAARAGGQGRDDGTGRTGRIGRTRAIVHGSGDASSSTANVEPTKSRKPPFDQ